MRLKKRTLVLLGVMVVAIAASIGAYAYFTTGGSGTGTATVGDSTDFVITSTTIGPALTPGGAKQEVHFTVYNPSSGTQVIHTITLDDVRACSGAGSVWDGSSACTSGGTHVTTCESFSGAASNPGGFPNVGAVDFYMAPTDELGEPITGGNTVSNASLNVPFQDLVMNDNGNQDSCKNVHLWLHFTSN